MSKLEIPRYLKAFENEFEKLTRRYDTTDVFCDFVDLLIAAFKFDGDKELGDRLKRKYKNDYTLFSPCIIELLNCYNRKIAEKGWFDGLGEIYETITSRHKSSRLGQFFTPYEVCVFSAQIIITEKEEGKTVNDPASGSGRMLLAAHAIAPKNKFYATDIDQVCTKMTAVNMCLHGMRGQSVCANSLIYENSWRFGFEVNPNLMFGLPGIESIEESSCFQSVVQKKYFGELKEKPGKIQTPNSIQLSLF